MGSPDIRDPLFDVLDRCVLVVGATGLLGRQYVLALAARGACPVVADVDLERCDALADEVAAQGHPRPLTVRVDVFDEYSIAECYATVIRAVGRIDAVINNAQVKPEGFYDSFPSYRKDVLMRTIEGNTVGFSVSCQHACRRFLDQGGKGVIVNVASIYGIAAPDQRLYDGVRNPYSQTEEFSSPVSYAVSKAGVVQLTRYLASYYRGSEIRVNCLVPGGVFDDHDERFVRQYSQRTLLGRMADRREYNGAILFLVSDASSYMTGAVLVVDGGWTAI